jgi:hypothetical protein
MAAGRRPQATLEKELEEVLGLEAWRGGRTPPFGQELGRGSLAGPGSLTRMVRRLTTKRTVARNPSLTPNWYSSRRPTSARSGRRRWNSAQDSTGARSGTRAWSS